MVGDVPVGVVQLAPHQVPRLEAVVVVDVEEAERHRVPAGLPPREGGGRVQHAAQGHLAGQEQIELGINVMLGVYPPLVSSPDNCVEGGSFRALIE